MTFRALLIALLLGACGVEICRPRDARADGAYGVFTDCSGRIARGSLRIGADSGRCGATRAFDTELLGLPNGVRVLAEGRFELFGPVANRPVDCRLHVVGSDGVLVCTGGGTCIAVLGLP